MELRKTSSPSLAHLCGLPVLKEPSGKRRPQSSPFDSLPDELLELILSSVPSRHLLSSVSTRWETIIAGMRKRTRISLLFKLARQYPKKNTLLIQRALKLRQRLFPCISYMFIDNILPQAARNYCRALNLPGFAPHILEFEVCQWVEDFPLSIMLRPEFMYVVNRNKSIILDGYKHAIPTQCSCIRGVTRLLLSSSRLVDCITDSSMPTSFMAFQMIFPDLQHVTIDKGGVSAAYSAKDKRLVKTSNGADQAAAMAHFRNKTVPELTVTVGGNHYVIPEYVLRHEKILTLWTTDK